MGEIQYTGRSFGLLRELGVFRFSVERESSFVVASRYPEGMGRNHLVLLIHILVPLAICGATILHPISDAHRSAALEVFEPLDGQFGSLRGAYHALSVFHALGIEEKKNVRTNSCSLVLLNLESSSSSLEDLFHSLKLNKILKCDINGNTFEGITSRLQSTINDASSLPDFFYSIESLVLVKDQTSKAIELRDAEGCFRAIKGLAGSNGRWCYNTSTSDSSIYAAGLAFQALGGIISLASTNVHQSLIDSIKDDIVKLFDSIEKYDDGAFFFEDKLVNAAEHPNVLSTTNSVVCGIRKFFNVISGNLNIAEDRILGIARFFLGVGIPGSAEDMFYQIDSLSCLESNRVAIPLILSPVTTVLSMSKNDMLRVRFTTVLGSKAPPASVNLVRVSSLPSSASSQIELQELKFDTETSIYTLENLPNMVDIGRYIFVLEAHLRDAEPAGLYITGGQIETPVFVSGLVKIDNARAIVLDTDFGSVEASQDLDLTGQNSAVLSANHHQKMLLSLELKTPRGNVFKPHQVFLKLQHESKVEHVFLLGESGKKLELVLDFLRLVEKLFYLSGAYDIELTIGDSVMENSVTCNIGKVELDLPEAPEKASRPILPTDACSRYGPKEEISHIFRAPEKRPPRQLSIAFLAFAILPLAGFFIGLIRLGVNQKNFPAAAGPATVSALFQFGIAGVLLLYALFWWKLNLFTTLKALAFMGMFLMFVGHGTLSSLASAAAKVKSA